MLPGVRMGFHYRAVSLGNRLSLPVIALLAVTGFFCIFHKNPNLPVIRSDGIGYYAYLPGYLIDRDPSLETLARRTFKGDFPPWTGIARYPATGRYLVQYPVGEALMMAPFFLAAHLLSGILHLPQDGYSPIYQYAAGLSGLFYMLLGLVLLKRLLASLFSETVVLATLVSITFGTNLFHYGTLDSIFSHTYSFCLITALLAVIPRWYAGAAPGNSALLGLVFALIVLVRIPNLIFGLFFVLYGLTGREAIRERAVMLWSQWRHLLIVAGVFALALLPQLLIWRQATGHWLVNSYQNDAPNFYFLHPKLLAVLFSVKKGLFFWSPLLLLSLLGVPSLCRIGRQLFWPTLLTLLLTFYLTASWHDWYFGGSYGHRAFTDGMALFALLLAAWFNSLKRPSALLAATVVVTLSVALSVVQMLQYWCWLIPFEGPTWDVYKRTFLHFSQCI